jgi:hypothetical protein
MVSAWFSRLHSSKRGRTTIITALVGIVLIATALGATALTTHKAKAANVPATATVNLDTVLSGVPVDAPYGVNVQAWDSHMTDSTLASQLAQAGVAMMRYPGGSTADNFHWYNQSVTCHTDAKISGTNIPMPGCGDLGPNDCSKCGVNFDQYMNVVHNTVQFSGAQPMITVNYGSGTPQEAGAWVAYANKNDNMGGFQSFFNQYAPTYAGASPTGHAYGIKYWEIGNEVYGDGAFDTDTTGQNKNGQTWELNTRTQATPGGTFKEIGTNAYVGVGLQPYYQVMKAVDPSIQIGAVLTAPGNWPDGVSNANDVNTSWNQQVLTHGCNSMDFVDIHWYPQQPGQESDAGLLNSNWAGTNTSLSETLMVSKLRSEIQKWCPSKPNMPIMVTETNSVAYNPGKQTTSLVNALFLPDDILTWLEQGVANVDVWAAHNSPVTNGNNSTSLLGNTNYGDFGLLSVGQGGEPPAETPFPSYYGLQMLTKLIAQDPLNRSNDELVSTASSAQSSVANNTNAVSVHAVRQMCSFLCEGNLFASVLLINKDPNTTFTETVTINNTIITANSTAQVSFYGQGSSSITTTTSPILTPGSNTFTIRLPPYSLTAVDLGNIGIS